MVSGSVPGRAGESRIPSARELREETARRLGGPAIALMIYFGLVAVATLGVLGVALVEAPTESSPGATGNGAWGFLLFGGTFAVHALGFAGALAMYRTKSYGLAVISVVVSFLPCCMPFSFVGTACGIWAATTLFRGTTPYAFRSQAAPPEVVRRATSNTGVWIALGVGAGFVVLLGGGIMAALAIYGVRRYVVTAKTAEAKAGLGQLVRGVSRCYAETGRLPPTTEPVPSALDLVEGKKYLSAPEEWRQEAFICAEFQMTMGQYYQYQWVQNPDGASGYAVARGDLDGDGQTSQFELHVECHDSCLVAPSLVEVDPLE
jgi:type IV pilus assembly protein PilA